jgi:hypothetical protein
MNDMAAAMTESLSRQANGFMQEPLRLVDGTSGAPGLAFVSEASTGMFRGAAGEMYFTALGTSYLRLTSTDGVQISADGTVWVDAVGTDVTDFLAGEISNNAADIAANTAAIGALDTRVTALEGAGTPDPLVAINFRSNGSIRHKLDDLGTVNSPSVDISTANRHVVNNNAGASAFTITLTGLPSGADPDLGNTFQQEGQVIVWNQTGGAVSVVVDEAGTVRTIGTPTNDDNIAQLLTYLVHRRSGTNDVTLVWSRA